ncbi:MAG: OmpA family protein [bacterium]|nr:MAG: OmpA family protein [bacterium]
MRSLVCLFVMVVVLVSLVDGAAGQDAWKGTSGLLHVYDAGTVGRGRLVFSLGTSYYRRADMMVYRGVGSQIPVWYATDSAAVDYNFFISRAVLTLGLSDFIELSAGLNVRNWIMQVDEDLEERDFKTRTRGGLGDTDFLVKLCPPLPVPYLHLGVIGLASFPSGSKKRGFTTESTDFGVKGLITLDFTKVEAFLPTRLHFNVGYRFNRNEDDGYGITNFNNPDLSGFYPPGYPPVPDGESNNFNDLFQFGTGLEFRVGMARLFAEFAWDQLINADLPEDYPGGLNKSVYTLTPGASIASESGVGVLIAGDINLNSEDNLPIVNPPDWMLYFMISVGHFVMPQDRDDDGIEDKVDKCPDEAEDFDGYEDEDGCPDYDNDKDGITDDTDGCPDLAEDFDGYEDEDGCPDLDNDGDGIPDVEDRCPSEPEDFDGFEDQDGCPDVMQDSDSDGVPDDMDKCPLKAEDVDGFQDEDGCPDLDNDLDGILDTDDQCPNEPETFNGFKDEDGCPDERPIEEKFILRGINFESGSAALTPDSYAILDQVVRSLMAYPEVRVEIRGYTDSVGSWEFNMQLSQRRADAVRQYLMNSGISPDRLVGKGYGEADPVASNKTASGRSENRRIEFHRLN